MRHAPFTIIGRRLIEQRAAQAVRELRAHFGEARAIDPGGKPGVSLHLIKPGVVDDYGSMWMPDVFDEALGIRLPTLVWAHDWCEPLGHGIDFKTSKQGPNVDFVFDDFDAVPMARRAHAQVASGTITDCSVGFSDTERRDPTDAEQKKYIGIREIILKSTCDETSLVLRGAVPGATVTGFRTANGVATVSEDLVVSLAKRVVAGEISQDEAAVALALAATPSADGLGDESGDQKTPEELEAEAEAAAALEQEATAALEAALDESDDVLAVLDGRSR